LPPFRARIICGWLSDKAFHGRRALPTVIFMVIVAAAIFFYWQYTSTTSTSFLRCLIGIGFFIYGPVMLIGVQSLDLAPKNAAGTAAGLTGFMGYVLGTAILANVVIGWVAQHAGWSWTFVLLIFSLPDGGCLHVAHH
jgi:OPA family glycerol-3-phosphate transporter-like MFS transporter